MLGFIKNKSMQRMAGGLMRSEGVGISVLAWKELGAPLAAMAMIALCAPASAQTIIPSDNDTSMMRGFPPAPDKIVTRMNQLEQPRLHWSLTHMRMLLPTASIARGSIVSALPRGPQIEVPSFVDSAGAKYDFGAWMRRTHTDALLVLHDGEIVFEGYADDVDPSSPHTMQSATKSVTGVAAAILIDEGKIDPNAPVARYIPELVHTAWGTATIQQALDMTTSLQYSEDPKDPNSDLVKHYSVASGTFPPPPGYGGPRNLYDLLAGIQASGKHGEGFTYKTPNPEVIAWVIARVTGKRPSEFVSERLWAKLGTEQDAYVSVDPAGAEMMGGGMSATARDLARFGEMLRLGGRYNGQQIVSAAVADEMFKGGDRRKFAKDPLRHDMVGYSYHDFWWVPPTPGVTEALGAFGQHIHINRGARTVIVKFSAAAIGPGYDEAKRLDPLGFAAIDALYAH